MLNVVTIEKIQDGSLSSEPQVEVAITVDQQVNIAGEWIHGAFQGLSILHLVNALLDVVAEALDVTFLGP